MTQRKTAATVGVGEDLEPTPDGMVLKQAEEQRLWARTLKAYPGGMLKESHRSSLEVLIKLQALNNEEPLTPQALSHLIMLMKQFDQMLVGGAAQDQRYKDRLKRRDSSILDFRLGGNDRQEDLAGIPSQRDMDVIVR